MVKASIGLVAATLLGASACSSGGGSANTGVPAPSAAPSGPAFSVGRPPAQQEPAYVVGGFSIDLGDPSIPPVVVQPGGESFPCLVFPLNLQGPSHIVGGGMLTPSLGLHHGNITTRPSDGTNTIHPCPGVDWTAASSGSEASDVLAGGAVLFGSTTQIQTNEWESFPTGMGYRIKDGYQIVAHMHYLNPSAQPVTVSPKYHWYTIDESKMTQELFPFAWQLTGFTIPPHTQQSFVGACDFASGMHVVNVLAHMHQLGVGLDAAFLGGHFDGQRWLTSPGYSPTQTLQRQYQPAIDLSQGAGMTMTCTWNNTTDQTIVEGTGINEMCIVFGYGYPQAKSFSAQISPGADTHKCFALAQ